MASPTHERIATLAYQLYVEEGQPEGRAENHWYRALELLSVPPLPSNPLSGPDAFHQQINIAVDSRNKQDNSEAILKTVRSLRGVNNAEKAEEDSFIRISFDARLTNPVAIFDAIELSRNLDSDADSGF